jgi:ABC-type transport system involved in Fe-S cluster assembly fused permease/ATPase subunit
MRQHHLWTLKQSQKYKSIKNSNKNKTTIVIAHRLSTILNSNNIYVIDSGKIIDHGNIKI